MNAQLSARECDFLLDLMDSSRDGKLERAARFNKVNPNTVYKKLARQADILDGIDKQSDY